MPPGSADQPFRTCEGGRGRVGHSAEHAAGQRMRPIGSMPRRSAIEHNASSYKRIANCLRIAVARPRLQPCSACPENLVERLGMLGWPGGLRSHQLDAERVRDPARDLVPGQR